MNTQVGRSARAGKNVYSDIKDMICFLDLKPGQLINEVELCDKLTVSRTPVREALIRLSDEKLINFFPQSGTYVTKIDVEYIMDLSYMRSVLEKSIVLGICGKVRLMDEFQEIMFMQQIAKDQQDTKKAIILNDMFHHQLFATAGHSVIWQQIQYSRSHYIRYNMLAMSLKGRLDNIYQEHWEILRCIESGNSVKLLMLLESQHDCNLHDKDDIIQVYPDYFGKLDEQPEISSHAKKRKKGALSPQSFPS